MTELEEEPIVDSAAEENVEEKKESKKKVDVKGVVNSLVDDAFDYYKELGEKHNLNFKQLRRLNTKVYQKLRQKAREGD